MTPATETLQMSANRPKRNAACVTDVKLSAMAHAAEDSERQLIVTQDNRGLLPTCSSCSCSKRPVSPATSTRSRTRGRSPVPTARDRRQRSNTPRGSNSPRRRRHSSQVSQSPHSDLANDVNDPTDLMI